MPELPEVETIRRQLEPRIAGRTITDAEVLDPLWCAPTPAAEVEAALRGAEIQCVGRRGKYLILELDDERFLVMHLRMTGNFLWIGSAAPEDRPYLRVRLVLDDGARLFFVDLRRFGTGRVIEDRDALRGYLAARLGPEPLEPAFTADVLRRAAKGRKAPVKAFLLDQRRIAGVGNIYADEALFRARIHPLKPAGSLRIGELQRLRDSIVDVLEEGIESFGASIDRYRDANGDEGQMQNRFRIHMREGEPCPVCGTKVRKLRAAGRGTYICPRCQRAPRAPRRTPQARREKVA
jgi:formamidopyrimidine-DNA glycosylase